MDWLQTGINALVTFGATYFGFLLVLRHENKKQALAAENERAHRAETERIKAEEKRTDDARRLQVLVVALLRELHWAMDEFRSPSYQHPRAEQFFDTLTLEQTAQQQLELIKSPEALALLTQVRPQLSAYKIYYRICLDNYPLGGSHNAYNVQNKEKTYFDQAASHLQTLLNNCKTDTRKLALALIPLCPTAVPEDLREDRWSL